MNSVQESKNELDAAIRYAENAISSAKQTIESMEFRQQMAQKNHQEQTGREAALEAEVAQLKSLLAAEERESAVLKDERTMLEKNVKYLRDENERLKREVEDYIQKYSELAQGMDVPTMPVIPKAVAIAIFREGMAYGAGGVCDEIDGETINICENEYCGDFEVTFAKDIDLDDYLDTDFLRSRAVDNCDEEWVVDCLKTLMECADNKFECRIHGVGDQEEKKND